MRFQISGYPKRVILYGDGPEVQLLCDEVLDLGFQPSCLLYGEASGDYRGVPVQAKAAIAQFQPADDLWVVPASSYHTLRKEIEAAHPALRQCVQREILFLAELLSHAELIDPPAVQAPSEPHTWMGMNLGFVMGGVETWVGETYHELRNEGERVKVIEPLQDSGYIYVGPGFYGVDPQDVVQIGPVERCSEYTRRTVELLCEDQPRIFIDNGSLRTMAGAYLAKKHLGIPIKVVSVIHGDAGIFYSRVKIFQEAIDTIVVVSDELRERALEIFPHRAADIKVKLRLPETKKASLAAKLPADTLHIAYAARLEVGNKRSLWLKDVAAGLAKRGVPFVLHIAGDGDCLETLRDFARDQGLEDRMRLYGRVDHSQMDAFYADKHAFVNFSISEGGPLTLFESMSHGLVPVVTDAGSAKRLIREGESGHIIDSPEQAVERLCGLAGDSDKLARTQRAALLALKAFKARQGDFTSEFR